jgi:hypothetical protein
MVRPSKAYLRGGSRLKLIHAYHYVQIVELLAEAGRFDEALEWAERGLAAFPDRTDVGMTCER